MELSSCQKPSSSIDQLAFLCPADDRIHLFNVSLQRGVEILNAVEALCRNGKQNRGYQLLKHLLHSEGMQDRTDEITLVTTVHQVSSAATRLNKKLERFGLCVRAFRPSTPYLTRHGRVSKFHVWKLIEIPLHERQSANDDQLWLDLSTPVQDQGV